MKKEPKKKNVLIRSYAAGVHFGELVSEKFTPAGKVVVLKNAKRIWSWNGAASLSQLAMEGVKDPGNSKISMPVTTIEVVNVIETIPLTPFAFNNLNTVTEWKK